MTPSIAPTLTKLAEPLDRIYRDRLATAFIGSTVEDWLAVRRLVERGWTLARVMEACQSAGDGVVDGAREAARVAEGMP